ncbi:MAG: gliding motility-associated C-terminal domain-containing protein [Bacteroidota bacterium]
MRKLFYLLIVQFILLQSPTFGQIRFTVELQEDNVTYEVKMRSENDLTGLAGRVVSSQVSLTIPAGGFKVDSIRNVRGIWTDENSNLAPAESPETDFLIFNLSGAGISGQDFVADEEYSLFSFKNVGECTGTIDFLKADNPYIEVARQEKSLSITNSIIVFGGGPVNIYGGSYGPPMNCLMSQVGNTSCQDVDTVITIPPSQCGLVGGQIIIQATRGDGPPLSYSIDDGDTFQPDSIFTGLNSSQTYVIVVKDEAGICYNEWGTIEIGPPIDARITGTSSTPDTCMQSNGTIQVDATAILGETILEYSVDNGTTWLENDGFFTGLAAGTYTPLVRAKDAPCNDAAQETVVAAACPEPVDTMGNGNENPYPIIEDDCTFTYVLSANNGVFTFSLLSDTTFTGPFAQVGGASLSLKVPTGSFEVTNFQNLTGAVFEESGEAESPSQDPGFDYIAFRLTSATSDIEITKGVTVPLFSFENGAICSGEQVFQPAADDPFSNNGTFVISRSIAVAGMLEQSNVCPSSNNIEIDDCGNVEGDGGMGMNPTTDTVYISLPFEETTTVCIEDELGITNIGTVELCNSPATVMTSLTNGSNCLDITTDDHFNQTEMICVVHVDANDNTVRDTTILMLCPQVELGPDRDICAGDSLVLSPMGGTGNFTWSGTGPLSCSDCPNPTVAPPFTSRYIVTSTEGDRCMDMDTLNINVAAVPTIPTVGPTQPTNCQDNGQINIIASGGEGPLQYSIDNGVTFQTSATFDSLGAGTYTIVVANADGVCTTTEPNAVELVVAGAPTFLTPNATAPNDCTGEKGSILILANSNSPTEELEYSIDGGTTWQDTAFFGGLDEGEYNLAVRIVGSDCDDVYDANPLVISQIAGLRFTDTPTDKLICRPSDNTMTLEINETITDYSITGGTFSDDNQDGSTLTFTVDPAAEGTLYTVSITGESGCSIMEEFTLTPGENTEEWSIALDTIPESCDGNDGALSLTVNENNNGFTFCWEPNKATGPMREGLTADSTYSLTITGSSGCEVVYDEINISTTCEVPSCNIFSGLDTLNAFVVEDAVTICLPVEGVDMRELEFFIGNDQQEITFGECMQTSVFYPYEGLFQMGSTPFTLTEWTVNSDTLSGFEFSTIEELVRQMNQFDFQANWVVDTAESTIQGFSTANVYGSLNIQTEGAMQIIELPLRNTSTVFQSITLEDTGRGVTRYTVRDPLNECEDDIFIKIQGMDDGVDTLKLVTIVNTPLLNQCLDTEETGTENLTIQVCNEPSAGILSGIDGETDECFGYVPNADFIGKDFFCLELCNGEFCDTTLVEVTVNPEGLVFHTGFSPNGDGINDVFTIKNIESYPDNNVLIYNRWGNRIFGMENYTNEEGTAWDGTFEDGLSPDGVYFYVIKITVNGEEEVHSGPVTVSR